MRRPVRTRTEAAKLLLRQPSSATTIASGAGWAPTAIAADDTSVYLAGCDLKCAGPSSISGNLVKFPLAGGAPLTLATGLTSASAIAVDSTSVYWADLPVGTVMKRTPK
jgi:hypothetical protein